MRAETLSTALDAALNDSPAVRGARAQLAEAQAAADIEQAAGRPVLSVQAAITPLHSQDDIDRLIVSLNGELPLYSGGRIRNMVSAARCRVEAAKADVARAEGDVLTAVATAFMAVIRDAAIVDLDRSNVALVATEMRANIALRRGGAATVTDIRQSEARLAEAQGRFWSDYARLASSEAEFVRVTGHAPDALRLPDRLPVLPDSDALVAHAVESPSVVAALAQAAAAQYDLQAAVAERQPTLSLVAEAMNRTGIRDQQSLIKDVRGYRTYSSAYVGLRFRMPIFGNGVGAQIRRRRALREAADANAELALREAVNVTVTEKSQVDAAVGNTNYAGAAVAASRAVVNGVRKERSVGQRTALDVLNAEQELRDNEVRLVSARTDAFSAAAVTLNAIGQARMMLDGGGGTTNPTWQRLTFVQTDPPRPAIMQSDFDLATLAGSRVADGRMMGARLAYAPEVLGQAVRLPYRAV